MRVDPFCGMGPQHATIPAAFLQTRLAHFRTTRIPIFCNPMRRNRFGVLPFRFRSYPILG